VANRLLELRNLRVNYLTPRGPSSVVHGLDLNLAAGQVLGLAGESGSGKSTVAQAILRLLPAPGYIAGGEVRFDGEDILRMTPERLRAFRWREAAMVFQSAMNALNPVLTIKEQLCDVFLAHVSNSTTAAEARARECLNMVGLPESTLLSFPHQLSGGMRQRVGIALALMLKPRLLILDEPTTALDVVVQKSLLDKLFELQRELQFSVLFITHDVELLFSYCTHIAILYAGNLVETAEASALRRTPQHPYSNGLLSSFPKLTGPRQRLLGIPGTPPTAGTVTQGCSFAPRCSQRGSSCEVRPELREVAAVGVAATQFSAAAQSSPVAQSSSTSQLATASLVACHFPLHGVHPLSSSAQPTELA
jgi:peptide/nickel transport system ATP-binding protein